VQNLFCKSLLECKIYFARVYWSAKFILREFIGVQNLFCRSEILFCGPLECKIYLQKRNFILRPFGVQNLFCGPLECKIYFAEAKLECKITCIPRQNEFCTPRQNKFCTPRQNKFCTPKQNKFCTPKQNLFCRD